MWWMLSLSPASYMMGFSARYGRKLELYVKRYFSQELVYVSNNMRFMKQFCSEAHKTKENPNSRIYKLKEEAKQGSDTDLLMSKMCYAEKEKVRRQEKEELTCIKEGDIINLPNILFTKNRDYLVKYNSDQQVKAEQLAGKIILMYFVPVCLDFGMESEWTTYLTDIYNDLLLYNKFEVIFIGVDDIDAVAARRYSRLLRDPQKNFENIFSRMPWTAIPFLDIASRRRVARRFGISGSDIPVSHLLDSKGMVLRCNCCSLFGKYGTLGYPFSNKRIQFLDSEDDAAAKQPSLETLLGSAERDYVISNKGDKVPIYTLKDKVVALYFYEDRIPFHKEGGPLLADDTLTVKLKMVYKELAEKKENFEVVLLYLYDTRDTFANVNEESFWKLFKTMPWLGLPFKDLNHKKLKRIFCYPWDSDGPERPSTLVVFGPNGEFVDPRAADILINFGTPAYPFTREKLVKLQTEKIKELRPEMFSNPNSLLKVKYELECKNWKRWLRNILGWECESDGSSFDNIFNFKKILKDQKELELEILSRYPNTVIGVKDRLGIQFSRFVGKKLLILFEMDSYYARDKLGMKLMLLKERYIELKGTDDEFEVIHIKESLFNNKYAVNLPWLVHYYGEGYPLPNELVPSVFGFNYYCGPLHFSGCSLLAFDQDGSLVRKTLYPTFGHKDFPFYAGGLEKEILDQLNYAFHLDYWDFHSLEIYKRNNDKAVK